jgi:DNA topoisomerase-1
METASSAVRALRRIGLHYVNDARPGIRRRPRGKSFVYTDTAGKTIGSEKIRQRIKSLVIPPAWTRVWICPDANGHLQATGRDARGRKQYRYHIGFRAHQDGSKFSNLVEFAQALPQIRRRVGHDLRVPGLPREKVIATIIRLLERTLIRVGNREYAEQNHSFGLSTLRNKPVKHCGAGLRFTFVGKSGVEHDVEVADRALAKIVFRCHDLPGQHLFEFRDEKNKIHAITSSDVNDYIHECAQTEFSAKNFRTWQGTLLAALAFERLPCPVNAAAGRRIIAKVVKDVAAELRNTPATCRKYYIHPKIIELFQAGELARKLARCRSAIKRSSSAGLSRDEQAVLKLLKQAASS